MSEPLKDPKGGLTAAGRAHFKRTEGANLKPGVKGPANTPEKMRRKGSFLTRFFTNPSGPMTDEKGKPTRLALSAAAWGEPVPKNRSDAAKLAAKGRRLLERYESVKKHAQHNQSTHGNWADSQRRISIGNYPDVDNPKDVEGKYSKEANLLAAQARADQVKYEPQLTDTLMRSLERNGASAYGLEYRIKSEKSIARKIENDSATEGKTRKEAAQKMGDIIRYTAIAEEGKYSSTIWNVLSDLRAQGIEAERIKNFWPKGDPYDGINIKMKHPGGFTFELQFHTKASIETKENSHKVYELYREETNTKKRWAYYDRMVRLWSAVAVPVGALEIGEQVLDAFTTVNKMVYRIIQRLDDDGNVVAEYRFSDANETIVEQRKTQDGWVDAHGEVVWYLISGSWDYEPISESVSKHGDHDQSTHGNWAKGRRVAQPSRQSRTQEKLVRATGERAPQLRAMAEGGGFTYNPKRNEIRRSGFVSAIDTRYEEKHSLSSFSEQTVRDYAAKHAEILSKPNHHLGAWTTEIDGETLVFLDVSVVMDDVSDAADLGRQYNQLAIFDLSTFTEWNRYRNPDGKDVYMPVAPYLEGMYEMAKGDDQGVMLVPGEMLDERSIAAIVAKIRESAESKPKKESRNNP